MRPRAAAGESVLERRYKAAQTFQASQELDKAAEQYRIFIADTLGQIALVRSRAGESGRATNDFDQALKLVPAFSSLQLEYARVSLNARRPEKARQLAADVLRQHPADAMIAAKAHVLLGRALLKLGKNSEAKTEIEKAVALEPSFENGYELAVADLDLGDGEGASNVFSEMLISFGDTARIHMLFGQAYLGSDFQSKAVDEFKKSIAKNDRLPGAHYLLASAYLATEGNAKLPEVEAELRKEIATTPANAASYAALGHLLANEHGDADQSDEALVDLKRATELDSTDPDGFLYLGQFYAESRRPAEAEAALRKSIALTSDISRNGYQVLKAHYLLGRLLAKDGNADESKRELASAQELLLRDLSRDQKRLADYLQQDEHATGPDAEPPVTTTVIEDADAAKAVDSFEQQFTPAIADSYNNLGAIAGSENKYTLALEYFEQAAVWNASLPGLDYNWGRAAFAAGVIGEAIAPLSRYLQGHPDDDGGRAVLGLSQFVSRDFAGARATLASVADKPGQSAQVRYAYAKTLVETNDVHGGTTRLQGLAKENPDVSEVHRSLGEAYAIQNAPGAEAELATAIRLNPKDSEAHAALGKLDVQHGNASDAISEFEAAERLAPNDSDISRQLEDARKMSQKPTGR